MSDLTEPTDAELDRLAEIEDAHQDEVVARRRAILAAAQEPGLLGDVRRAINAARRQPSELAAAARVDVRRLEDFRAGETSLADGELARVVAALDLALVPATAAD